MNHNVSVQIPLLGWPRRRHISRMYARIGSWSAIARKMLKVRSLNGKSSRIGQHLGGKSDSERDKTREIGETLWESRRRPLKAIILPALRAGIEVRRRIGEEERGGGAEKVLTANC